MKEERAIELLESYRRKVEESLECNTDYRLVALLDERIELLDLAIHCVKNRIVARELADDMVKTIRSGKDDYKSERLD